MACSERQVRWCISYGATCSAACSAEYVKEAVQEDQNNNYDKAFELYKIALEYFSTHLKYEKNPRSRAAIQEKVGSLCRAQHIWCTGRFGVPCM
jgi:MIT (microtubule interacting and transport) domain